MSILHLADDIRLINGAYELFEEYYPGRNVFVIQTSRGSLSLKQVLHRPCIFPLPLSIPGGLKDVLQLAELHRTTVVCVHYLSPTKAAVAMRLKRKLGVKLAWMFYGADLYAWLSKKGRYKLTDDETSMESQSWSSVFRLAYLSLLFRQTPDSAYTSFIKSFDFFCFWNPYDFQLLKQNFETKALFRFYAYYNLIDRSPYKLIDGDRSAILVNHSASSNGNHLTVLHRLKELGVDSKIIVPVSYGAAKVQQDVIAFRDANPSMNLMVILEFLAMPVYYRLVESAAVAVFGHRRQEGAGNIIHLLSHGVKIYLRNDNNMLQWLRELGCVIFSFEDDLSRPDAFAPLPEPEGAKNRAIIQSVFSKENEQIHMMALFS